MSTITISPASGALRGTVRVPGDKSIAHRALLLGAIARGETVLRGFAGGEDNRATRDACRALGVRIDERGDKLRIHGRGWDGLAAPAATIDCRNSGTTMRFLPGILAGRPFTSRLDGDASLRRRPMQRVIEPLVRMGAAITSTDGRAPLVVEGRRLHGASHDLAIASAQVKSALLLAGLQADGETRVREPAPSRDHTERLLAQFGATLARDDDRTVRVRGPQELSASEVTLPGDLSSAAFFLVAALLVPGSTLRLPNVGVNPTRAGILDVLAAMGAEIGVESESGGGEPHATLVVAHRPLRATRIAGDDLLRAIDEFPILCVAAAAADGTSEIRDAAELRLKESDRIATMAATLGALGVRVEELADGLVIHGPARFTAARIDSQGDHRIAMAAAVAGLAAAGDVVIDRAECAEVSFPRFYATLDALRA